MTVKIGIGVSMPETSMAPHIIRVLGYSAQIAVADLSGR